MSTKRNQAASARAAAEAVSRARRELCRTSILTFGKTYLSHYFKLPPSPFHREMAVRLEQASLERGARLAVAAPRGHAKSTLVSLAFALWSICYRLESFIILLSNTAGQAENLLDAVKSDLEQNGLLQTDFPMACELPGLKPGPPRWTQSEIITRNGIRITALGAGQNIRGRRHNEHRPGLIVLDDAEDQEGVRSADQRDKLRDWFFKCVLKAGDRRTNVVVIGTIMHYDSLLAGLTDGRKSPGWWGRKYQAVLSWPVHLELWEQWEDIYCGRALNDEGASGPEAARAAFESMREDMSEGTQVLWPAQEDFYALMEIRLVEGRASFDSEKQNEPLNPADCCFQESDFVFWDVDGQTEASLLQSLRGHCRIIGACDPSLGRAGRGYDDTAIITLAWDTASGTLYILDADIRRRSPDQIIDAILAHEANRRYACFGVEVVQFQQFLADELRRRGNARGFYPRIVDIRPTSDKLGRIQALQPLMRQGIVRFSRRHTELLEELRQFPKGAHDDGPDALEMAVSLAKETARTSADYGLYLPVIIRTPRPWRFDDPGAGWYPSR